MFMTVPRRGFHALLVVSLFVMAEVGRWPWFLVRDCAVCVRAETCRSVLLTARLASSAVCSAAPLVPASVSVGFAVAGVCVVVC